MNLGVGRRLLGALGVLATGLAVAAQSAFLWQGGEYQIAGGMPGDQVFPSVSIGRDGGYLVWQDNAVSASGFSIRAQRLDGALSGVYGHFKVNNSTNGSHELPQVALLSNGGAVVVWQKTTGADSDVMARFLSPSGTFTTDEIRINSFTAGDQRRPSVAALSDGGAVVVWSSFEQDGSLMGVYGQRLANNGLPAGDEFRVNQTTAYNQRDAVVAPTASGGFVVAWVSEQQRFALSVDVYGRLFNADGSPAGDETRLNATDDMAMTPAVSGRADGGYVAAWMQRDSASSSNSWDIHYAVFNAAGARVGGVARVNRNLYGDQFSPRLSPTGVEHLVVWTSLGQDGSQEGVFGRFVGSDGALQGDEFQVNTTQAGKQIHPTTGADGSGRLLAVWAGFHKPNAATPASFDLFAQRFDAVRPVPTPGAPQVQALSSDSLGVTWPALLGFSVAGYEVFVDGGAVPLMTTVNSLTVTGLAAGSEHTVRLRYWLADGRRSELSAPASGKTWGADNNGDGLPDDWQNMYFGKTAAFWPVPNADSDGDGASDRAEFLAGTNPRDPNSVLRSELTAASGQLRFHWSTQPGNVYQVQVSTNLVDWVNVGAPRFAAGGADSVPIEQGGGMAVYRVILVR